MPDSYELSNQEVTILVRFTEYPDFNGNKISANVKAANNEKLLLIYYLKTEKEKDRWFETIEPGLTCQISGSLEVPKAATNPNAFDYKQYLLTQKVKYILQVGSMDLCHDNKKTIPERIKILREKGIRLIQSKFPETVAPFVTALLFGEPEGMDGELQRSYQKLGVSHLLAISGLHVTIFTASLYFLMIRFSISRESARNLLIIFLPIYAIVAGGSPSVNRAVLMSWSVLFLSKHKIKIQPVDALGLTFLIFITLNPYAIFHVGFQLSYLVAICLILSRKIYQFKTGAIKISLIISFIAFYTSIPVILNNFYEFSLLTILTNLVFVPIYSNIILPLSFIIFTLLLLFPGISNLPIGILSSLISWVNKLAEWLGSFDFFTLTLGKPPFWLFVIYIISIILFFIVMEINPQQYKKSLFAIFVVPLVLQILVVKFSLVGEVTVLDVGQGDSIFISLPFNQGNYLIDSGGAVHFNKEEWQERDKPYDPGESVVIPFLKSRGVTKINKLILTHGDHDHIGGAKAVIEQMKIDQILVGDTIQKKDQELEIIEMALDKGIEVMAVYEGMEWRRGRSSFQILSPIKGNSSSNDSSIVIYAFLGKKRWLFTGDMEVTGEKRLLQHYPHIKTDILKAGHHGSDTSSSESFVKQVAPEVAIISVGENNRYGHPKKQVLDTFDEQRILIYRTDDQGAISYFFLFNSEELLTTIK